MSFNYSMRYLGLFIVMILVLLLLPALVSRPTGATGSVVLLAGEPVSMFIALVIASTVAYLERERRLRGRKRPAPRLRGAERKPVLPREEEER